MPSLKNDLQSTAYSLQPNIRCAIYTRKSTEEGLAQEFNSHEVSFVSVTQQFNTTTSMGRLTLNILLSFAQACRFGSWGYSPSSTSAFRVRWRAFGRLLPLQPGPSAVRNLMETGAGIG